ncbi:hypothetical protein PVAP13_1KG464100 [Panicum virgatum]|uniref:PWWP domain-containing protein n=1 Tax=Panicum virgatum TaxID=38727 RepID=A0A8T0XHD3_PANVG|nr:hypothetical protein PVAP13_1KG464100 [Panicum virgatum]
MVGSSVEVGADGDGGCCGVGDTLPGTIVWVRRRNGSWWPGRILGPEELPPSQIMSPRSGTPVKLLGREDASVDWYNLEKSKRVKAFRCGEFDACIEKAEATQGTLVKKREKYARREDAILHALELERKQLASKYQTQGFRPGPHGNISAANVILPIESRAPDPYLIPASDKFRHVDYDDNETTYSTYMPQLNELEEEDGSSELGVSQWHMKGKRNSRNAAKRLVDMTDGNTWLNKYNSSLKGPLHKTNGGNPRKESMQTSGEHFLRQSFYQVKGEPDYDSEETDLFEDTSHSEVNLYRGKKYHSSLRTTRDLNRSYSYFNDYENGSSNLSPLNKDADRVYRVDRNVSWDGPTFYQRKFTSRFGGMGPMLFDVDLKVQASYQGEHVPLVSLMSRLNGKAIVGHPIQIEILEDGSTDNLVFRSDSNIQESTAAPPAWPTGRRTAMQRVPRSNPSGALLDGDNDGGLAYSDWEMKPTLRKYSSSSNHQVKTSKNSSSNARRSSAKSHKKSSKKTNLSSQKVRALSSISTGKKYHGEGSQAKAHWRNDIFGGLIRSGPGGAVPLVTCVPTKVVFTRILEAVGRPPLSAAHRVRMASP